MSAEPETHTGDMPAPEATQDEPGPSVPRRSILFFLGGGKGKEGSSATPPAAQQPAARRKRKAAPDQGQARLKPGTTGWTVEHQQDPVRAEALQEEGAPNLPNGTDGAVARKGKAKKGDGEEAEVRDMMKRTKSTRAKGKPGPNGQNEQNGLNGHAASGEDVDMGGLAEEAAPSPAASPEKKKRGRPRKSQVSHLSQPSLSRLPSPPTIVLSSDPVDPDEEGDSSSIDRPSALHTTHPILRIQRTLSSSSKGASHDPIDVETTPGKGAAHDPIAVEEGSEKPGRRKLVFASDNKRPHAFFAHLAPNGKGSASRDSSVLSDAPSATTAATAATAPPSEAPSTSRAPPKKKVHAFFAMNGAGRATVGEQKGWGNGVKEGEEPVAPLPGGIWPNHTGSCVDRNGESSTSSACERRGRQSRSRQSLSKDLGFWRSVLVREDPPRPVTASSRTNGNGHRFETQFTDHPAISSLSNKATSAKRSKQEGWCERFAPRRAAEVLGNEVESTYLVQWLLTLQLRSARPGSSALRVQRKVRRSKRQNDDGWIVDDIGMFGDPVEEESEDEVQEPYEEPDLALGERPGAYTPLDVRLTNTIMLAGPNGSGKSAAVYAAAAELGWEVFEVNPGMGKRTGGNVASWVGDVGRNHLVVSSEEKKDKKDAIKGFFGKKQRQSSPVLGSQGSVHEPIDIDEDDDHTAQVAEKKEATVRQSLILIDEVDILFEEETTFWPAVVSLIAESRRPIVLTCNDPSSVPLEQLPLQTVLHFQPAPADLAISYLDSLARHSGVLQPGYAAHLHHRCTITPQNVLDRPLPPNGNEPLGAFDLRRAIVQMQLERAGESEFETQSPTETAPPDFVPASRAVELRSLADALTPPTWAEMDVTDIDRYNTTADDMVGIRQLVKPPLHDDRPCLGSVAYDACTAIASALHPLTLSADVRDLPARRAHYSRSLLPILDPLISLNSYLLPHPSLFTDYMPVIRDIVRADDMFEMAEDAVVALGGERMNRKTGRPVRLSAAAGVLGADGIMKKPGYSRYLDMSDEALKEARKDPFAETA